MLYSLCKNLGVTNPNMNKPNSIMIVPPMYVSILCNWNAYPARRPNITPKIENTTVNPNTYISDIMNILCLLLERYAKKPGIKGNMHGEKKLSIPAKNINVRVTSIN